MGLESVLVIALLRNFNLKPKLGYDITFQLAESGITEFYDILITDPNPYIRGLIVKYGDDSHKDILVYDSSIYVRKMVARYGNNCHKEILKDDESEIVRNEL